MLGDRERETHVPDDLPTAAELAWENEGGRERPAPPDRESAGSNDD